MRNTIVSTALMLLLLTPSCAHNRFVAESLKRFDSFTLSNGIPVHVHIMPHSRTQSLVCTLRGGKLLVPPDKAGLDSIALRLMTMESQSYSDVERQALLKKTSADIGAVDGLDFSQYSLTAIDMYFDAVFDLYADLLLRPVFREDLFDEVLTNMHNAYRAELTDGFARVSQSVNTRFFAGHPYAAHIYTPDTLSGISLDDVKRYYQDNVTAGHMALFAAGPVAVDRLRGMLEKAFGSLPPGPAPAGVAPPFSASRPCPLVLDASDAISPEAAYVRGNFPVIALTHPDYWALQLASRMLSDLLADRIRTRSSLVYSVWSTLYGRQANYGTIAAYRTSDPVLVAEHIRYCIDVVASGRCLSPYAESGGEEEVRYVAVDRGLEYYKRSLSTGFYSGLQQSSSIARQMAASGMLTGNPADYVHTLEKVGRVSAEDVTRAAQRYLREAPLCWAVTAHPEVITRLRENHAVYAPRVVEAGLP